MGVFDSDLALFNFDDLPGSIPQLKDIALHTFNREIFVDGSDYCLAWLEDYLIISGVRNRSTGCDCRQSRSAPTAQTMIDHIVMQIGAAATATGAESFGKHPHNFIESGSGQVSIWIGATDHREQIIFGPFFRRYSGDDLLRQNVQWSFRDIQLVQLPS